MNHSSVPPASVSAGVEAPPEGGSAALPRPPTVAVRPSGWTAGRITAIAVGVLLALVSVGLLLGGVAALWADRTQRDAAGYVTTDTHRFSTSGSALVTEPAELGSPGVGWLYSEVALGEVRIRVTPVPSDAEVFVGIGSSDDVDRYLAGVGHTHIFDFWSGSADVIGGGAPGAPPQQQDFWVASSSGSGSQTLLWEPANGTWTVVVMNASGRPGIDVETDLGATMPALSWIAGAALVVGALFALGGSVLIVGAIRRVGRAKAS